MMDVRATPLTFLPHIILLRRLQGYALKKNYKGSSQGCEGYVAFKAKSRLIQHYEETLGAYHFRNQRLIIDSEAARFLVTKYFKTL